jgi:hypothetical protein
LPYCVFLNVTLPYQLTVLIHDSKLDANPS